MVRTKLYEPRLHALRDPRPGGSRTRLSVVLGVHKAQKWPVLRVLHVALQVPRSFPRHLPMTPRPTTTPQDRRRYARGRTGPEQQCANSELSRRNTPSKTANTKTSISSSMKVRTLRTAKLSPLLLGICITGLVGCGSGTEKAAVPSGTALEFASSAELLATGIAADLRKPLKPSAIASLNESVETMIRICRKYPDGDYGDGGTYRQALEDFADAPWGYGERLGRVAASGCR